MTDVFLISHLTEDCFAPYSRFPVVVQEENLNVAFGLLHEMASQQVEADATTYTTLFNLCAEARQGHQALQLMQVLPACLMHPDVVASASSWWVSRNRHHKRQKSVHSCVAGPWLLHVPVVQSSIEDDNLYQSFQCSYSTGLSSSAVVLLCRPSQTNTVCDNVCTLRS